MGARRRKREIERERELDGVSILEGMRIESRVFLFYY